MKIVWTRKARNRLVGILDYIDDKFGGTARDHFKIKTKEFTMLLSEFPEIGTLEIRDRNLRGFQLTKQTRVFYRIQTDKIIILTLFDSRQDPKKRPR
jgi:plasmid stabilization system protein ParE